MAIHLFVRDEKLAGGMTALFVDQGRVRYRSHQGAGPISVVFDAPDAMPWSPRRQGRLPMSETRGNSDPAAMVCRPGDALVHFAVTLSVGGPVREASHSPLNAVWSMTSRP